MDFCRRLATAIAVGQISESEIKGLIAG